MSESGQEPAKPEQGAERRAKPTVPATPARPSTPGGKGGGVPDPGEGPDPWSVVGYLVSGLAVWGGVGYLIDRWTGHSTLFFPIGLVFGLIAGGYLAIVKINQYDK